MFDPQIGKILWGRAWQSILVVLSGESPWTKEPGRLQSMWSQRIGHNWVTKHSTVHTQTHTHTYIFFFQIIFSYTLLQNIEYSSLIYTVGPCWLSIIYIIDILYLDNSLDRGARWIRVHEVAKSQTQLKWLSNHTCKVRHTLFLFKITFLLIFCFFIYYLELVIFSVSCGCNKTEFIENLERTDIYQI